ncbi:MAG: hypothetical protein Q9188_002612 [Gyalolechia gomerana]
MSEVAKADLGTLFNDTARALTEMTALGQCLEEKKQVQRLSGNKTVLGTSLKEQLVSIQESAFAHEPVSIQSRCFHKTSAFGGCCNSILSLKVSTPTRAPVTPSNIDTTILTRQNQAKPGGPTPHTSSNFHALGFDPEPALLQ